MKFKIEYRVPDSDPEQWESVEAEFTDSQFPVITALEWAEDYAYSLADKGPYKITEVK